MDGYVSFANVEGLGEPPEVDLHCDLEDADPGMKGWMKRLRWPFAISGHGAGVAASENDGHGSLGLFVDNGVANSKSVSR